MGIRAMQGYRMQKFSGMEIQWEAAAVIVQLAGVTDDRFYNRIQRRH